MMLKIEQLSKIGLGTYRMSINDDNHFKSLQYAVDRGINLIDTASNYLNGNSERLVGSYVKKQGRNKIFITTKAGYIHGDDLKTFASDLDSHRCIKIQDGFHYCFEKSFLMKQINLSLKKLNTNYLDGFLIHNPEYYLSNANISESIFYEQLNESLIFLEDLAKKGIIRYYGISSNKLPTGKVDICKILKNGYNLPNFRLLQFPYNFIENEASCISNNGTLIEFCKKNNIKTFANRPLTTKYNNKVLRIADYSGEISEINFIEEQLLFDDFLSIVSNRLKYFDTNAKLIDFIPLSIIINNRKGIANPEAVDKIVNEHLLPFINQLQFNENEKKVKLMVQELSFYWKAYSKVSMTKRASNFKKELMISGEIGKEDARDFSLIACEKYLEKGIDHVLVGMRKIDYVDGLKSLL